MPKLTDGAQKRIARELGRTKGESIEILERLAAAAAQALTALRAGKADACLPPNALSALHTAHTSMGKLFSTQHRARAFKDVIRLIEE